MKCVTFVSETFTRYGSNITNALQEILTPITLEFSCKFVHEKLCKSVNICKSCGKKISGTFFYVDTVYIQKMVCMYYNFKNVFACYKQKCKLAPFNWAHPVCDKRPPE